jgi:hypothetical protein
MTAEQFMRAPINADSAITASPFPPTVFAPGAQGASDNKLTLSAHR